MANGQTAAAPNAVESRQSRIQRGSLVIRVTLPDGSAKEVESGTTAAQIAESLGQRLSKAAVAAKIDGEQVDLSHHIQSDCNIEILTDDSPEGIDVLRHTAGHVMAQAVVRLYPGVRLAIGPTIEKGFYYDFDFENGVSTDDLDRIEAEMKNIIDEDLPIEHFELPRGEAVTLMEEDGQAYKAELIRDLPNGEKITFYKQGDFVDLCRGPHLPSTGRVKAYKLINTAGAYWRGDSTRPMLTRIYGTAFRDRKELKRHLHMLEEARRRDHRKLGKELDLYSFHEEAPASVFWHPKGVIIWNELLGFWRSLHRQWGYQEIRTPIMLKRVLWERSGHWEHYKENMYFTQVDEEPYALKPMNCPGAALIYKTRVHSYRELPLRYAEVGICHRLEKSGVVHGLMRLRQFTQDDAHIFMMPEQVTEEVIRIVQLIDKIYGTFGLEYRVELSTRPESSVGTGEQWEQAINGLKDAIEATRLEYKINEGDGAFYGPKIDFHVRDAIGRSWQCATIQLDLAMVPEKFDVTYVGADGREHRPVVIHRVILGAIERFIGILIEHYAGDFPTWLAPVQAMVLPITDAHAEYALAVHKTLLESGIRADIDLRSEKTGAKIRDATISKIPYMLIVGDRELQHSTVSVRLRKEGDQGAAPVQQFVDRILTEIRDRE